MADTPKTVHIRLLGPVAVSAGERPVALPGRRQRTALAALALCAGRVVPADQLMKDLWDEQPPRTASSQVQTSVWMLRRALAAAGVPPLVVRSCATGYLLDPSLCELDIDTFRSDLRGADELRRQGLAEPALHRLLAALARWRGPALAGIASQSIRARAVRLEEERLAALEHRLALEITLGRHREVVGELTELVDAHPLREGLHANLMLALYRSGRQADALAVFRNARRTLAEELGIDPGLRLHLLERAILRQDDALLETPTFEPHPVTELLKRVLW